jgi:hypothetical protein
MSTEKLLKKDMCWNFRKATYFFLLLFICSSFMFINHSTQSDPIRDGYVPDEMTAIKIAEAIWLPIYGNEIYKYKPFKAKLIGGKVWEIYGTVYTQKGGSPIAKIRKSDCKIIEVTHEL